MSGAWVREGGRSEPFGLCPGDRCEGDIFHRRDIRDRVSAVSAGRLSRQYKELCCDADGSWFAISRLTSDTVVEASAGEEALK
ncbi:hypothetical protein SAMN04488003_12924 [Loktanella fryxellensis]|uniref:Uncharacterized protein n=1 Tax=Loktanella fryxellensis TaxID=245187 RepID=A0A1H8IY90_9RHOB|nr:hypothetical protein SAMN04488003_12924 [Loktanella fryxellensis]